jgi:DNA-cytosine methyltransferase
MKHGSLFSGIGGFDYAAQLMGWENVFHCEWNEFGQRVLNYYWPKAISYNDITKTDFTIHRGTIDVLTGGFPCQPYSQAGKRLGKEDERHLWPEMLRAIREIQPTWIVGENVFGLINWNGGLVFDEIQTDLETQGYEVQAYVLPACGVNAPHRRDRIWFVAYSPSIGARKLRNESGEEGARGGNELSRKRSRLHGDTGATPDADCNGHELRGFGEDRRKEEESKENQQERERIWADNSGTCEQGATPDACGSRLQQLDTPPPRKSHETPCRATF